VWASLLVRSVFCPLPFVDYISQLRFVDYISQLRCAMLDQHIEDMLLAIVLPLAYSCGGDEKD
jgi:hypothetical protein